MKRALAVAALVAAAGCSKNEPEVAASPASTVVEWAQQSPDGRFEVRLRRDTAGCRVQAVVKPGDRVLWTSQTCLPTPSGLVFLSANGESLLVLDLFPSSAAAQGADWTNLPLASCWSRGAVVRQYTGGEILAPQQVQDMRRALSWVKGDTFEDAHRAARASADGNQVVVDLVDGRTLTFGFEGAPLPTPTLPAKAPPARTQEEPLPQRPAAVATRPPAESAPDPLAADEQGLYRWEDEQGGLHFGAGAQIPPRYRKRAVPVSASVGVVPLDHAAPAPPPQPVTPVIMIPAPAPAAGSAPAPAQGGAPTPAGGAQPPPSPAAADRSPPG